jgi:hypothetical protein
VKVGDLVELSAASQGLIWPDPFRGSIGMVLSVGGQTLASATYRVRWMKVKKYEECSWAFRRKTKREYEQVLSYVFTRKELKHAKKKN